MALLLILVALVVGLIGALFLYYKLAKAKADAVAAAEAEKAKADEAVKAEALAETLAAKTQAAEAKLATKNAKLLARARRKAEAVDSSPLHVTSLKGHTKGITYACFSPDEKFVCTCSEDRTLRLWPACAWTTKPHPYVRVNVEFDHTISAGFSTDGKYLAVGLASSRLARVFHIGKKSTKIALELEATPSTDNAGAGLIAVDMAADESHKYVLKCYRDTTLELLSLKAGSIVKKVDTKMLHNSWASISPCGRYFGVSGFTPDVKIWAVLESVGGVPTEIKQVSLQ